MVHRHVVFALDKKAMMGALVEDQRVIEGVLEGERLRIEESLRAAAAARKARDERYAEEDAAEERCDDQCLPAILAILVLRYTSYNPAEFQRVNY